MGGISFGAAAGTGGGAVPVPSRLPIGAGPVRDADADAGVAIGSRCPPRWRRRAPAPVDRSIEPTPVDPADARDILFIALSFFITE
jgi:hypothetical protein